MMKCRIAIALATALTAVLAVPLSAGQLREDFARGITVEVGDDGPLFELSVPAAVYDTVTRPDVGDLRVFNRDGTVVPHAVRRPRALLAEAPAPRALPFFPLRGRGEGGVSGRALRIVTDDRGAIVTATSEDVRPGDADRVVAYLVDASTLEVWPDTLALDWEGEADDGFAVTLDVESSDDLARWRTVVSGVTLARLRSGGAELVHSTITLPSAPGKYLRLEWPEALRAIRLTGVRASFPAQTQPLVRESMRLRGLPVEAAPGTYDFDTGGVWPVDRVQVVFDERNTVAAARVLSRPTAEEAWRRRQRATFYSLERDGAALQNEPARVAVTPDRYWRLEFADGEAWTGQSPTLELAWVPDVLTVVAQGEGPFTVAFGSATVDEADRATDGLLTVLEDERGRALLGSARASDVFALGGDSRLVPPPAPLPWRTWVLWAVLVAGVGLLGWMVRQLVVRVPAG
jgi:hypothetical protein